MTVLVAGQQDLGKAHQLAAWSPGAGFSIEMPGQLMATFLAGTMFIQMPVIKAVTVSLDQQGFAARTVG